MKWLVDDEAEGTIEVLVLTELSKNCVGYVIVGQETRPVKNQICKWLDHFGLASRPLPLSCIQMLNVLFQN